MAGAAGAAGIVLAGCGRSDVSSAEAGKTETEGGISPAEDLMREHGVLRRMLLVYEEAASRLEAGKDMPANTLSDSAGIIRSFIEEYHEKLEEDFLFPRFRKANRLVELVEVLLEQHKAGRSLTDAVLRLGAPGAAKTPEDTHSLTLTLRAFTRMYAPHAAREDTVLFPAIRETVTGQEYYDLGEKFEDMEHELFGEEGFEKTVDRVAAIEKALGIYDLKQFTPGGEAT